MTPAMWRAFGRGLREGILLGFLVGGPPTIAFIAGLWLLAWIGGWH